MKVVLPDSSELELPAGATGLDAARAIGPKLADEAVLVRSNGRVQDLRLPLEDGQPIQILTTRDKDDPDALSVLRHSSAHLLAEAVRRLYPGVKIAIGPPIDNGFYYDFEFPEAIGEEMRRGVPQNGERVRVVLVPRCQDLDGPPVLERQPQILNASIRTDENGVVGELRPDRPGRVEPCGTIGKFEFGIVGQKDFHDRTG